MHDVIGCYLDLDNIQIKFSKNGKDLGLAFTILAGLRDTDFFPSEVLKVSYNKLFYIIKFLGVNQGNSTLN